MKKRTIYLTIFAAFSLYLGACGSVGKDTGALSQQISDQTETTEQKPTKDSTEQENTEAESIEQELLKQEQRRSELAADLNAKFAQETGTFLLAKSQEEKAVFVEWLLDTYGWELLKTVDFSEDINRQFYAITGKSLHVLWDTSLGYLEDPETAAAHFIYLRETEDPVVDLAFAGDICLTEEGYVIDHYDEVGGDINLCLSEEIMDRFNEADISMINHEYPVSTRGEALNGKYYTFRADPEREIILQQMGIDIVSLANNHVYDYDADAFYDTLEVLKQIEIPYVGAGADIEEASEPVFFVAGGIKIGFAAANRSEKYIYTPEAGENSPGVVRMYDTAMMNDIIKEVSEQCDYLIVYVHWGTENSKYYEEYQTEIAQEFFDSGADAIIGSHPHVLQGIGYVDGKPVVYSLGDFWFNAETKYTTIVNLKVTIDGLVELSVLPCRQEGYETHYLADESEQSNFYEYLRKLSPEAVIDDNGIVIAK